jgi:predicted RecA/RadA family phage recombinase
VKSLKYVGPHDAVEVEVAPQKWSLVTNGQVVEVGDTLAAALLDQPDNWKSVTKKAAKPDPTEG